MRELMDQGEHLGPQSVSSIDEDEGSHRIHQSKPPELLRVKDAPGITAHNATHHDKHTQLLDPVDQSAPRVLQAQIPQRRFFIKLQ